MVKFVFHANIAKGGSTRRLIIIPARLLKQIEPLVKSKAEVKVILDTEL